MGLFEIFLSNIFHYHEKIQKTIKTFENFEFFFFKIYEKNMSWKNWFLPKCFQKSNSAVADEYKNGGFVIILFYLY